MQLPLTIDGVPRLVEFPLDLLVKEFKEQTRLVDREGLADKLNVSLSTVDRLRTMGKIPFLKVLGDVRFEVEAVKQALKERS